MTNRCPWSESGGDLMMKYHDEEWGTPVHDDNKHYEFLVLEINQAGLSWNTVLRKRENYRRAYDGFVPVVVAGYGEDKVLQLLDDAGIIRNRRKIEASIHNAALFLEVQREFGSFDNYLWRFTDGRPVVNGWRSESEIPPKTALSDEVSADLKKRGFKFVGSTIIYAHLQAVGVVNDHVADCFRFAQLTGR